MYEGIQNTKVFHPWFLQSFDMLKVMSNNITSVSRDKQHIEVITWLGKPQTFGSSKIQPLE